MIVKKVISEKEQEKRHLHLRNKDLEKINQELLNKNNEYSSTIHKIKLDVSDKMSDFDLQSKQKEKEIVDLKIYYEDRITYITNSYNSEKKRMFSENEKNLEK